MAGFGTRFLPATKSMPKELLPVIDKPLIQYAVEEAAAAGIEVMVFVTGRNKRAIEDHFDSSPELERTLVEKGRLETAEYVKNILPKDITCAFVRQPEQLGLGHAVLCARPLVGEEPFAVLLADDFITKETNNTTLQLCRSHHSTGKNQLSMMTVEPNQVDQYGILEIASDTKTVIGIVEKPTVHRAPSNSAAICRYFLNAGIFDVLQRMPPGKNGEIQLTDAINELAKLRQVETQSSSEKRFDCGQPHGFLEATLYEAKRRGMLTQSSI